MTPEQFLLFANSLPEPMLLLSKEGRVLAGNGAVGKRLGIVAEQLRGRNLADVVTESADEVAHYLRLCSRSRQLVLGALSLCGSDSPIACRAEGSLLRPKDEHSQAVLMLRLQPKASAAEHFLALNERIEQLRKEVQRRMIAEATVRDQKERLHVTLQSIGDGVIVTDPEGRVSALNPVAEALTGWQENDAAGQRLEEVFNIVNEETFQPVENPALRALREGVIVGLANHTSLIAKDGTHRSIDDSAAPIRDADGNVIGAVLIFRDITERKRSEASLRYQFRLTRTITENATTAIFMLDSDNRCTFMNPAAERMIGYGLPEVEGRILHDLIHHQRPDGRPYPLADCPIVRALPERADVVAHEDMFIRKNGESFPVLCNVKPIHRDGVPVGAVVEVRDISQEKAAKEATMRRSRQLRRLAQIATRINIAQNVHSVMEIVAEEARELIGAHQAVASMTTDQKWGQAVDAVSLSEKYAKWRHYDEKPDGSGIYSLVAKTNTPMRLTQAELESHPAWKGFGIEAGKHPPIHGWLAVPLVTRGGKNQGLLQLSDKYDGEFSEDDESILVQLANIAAVAIENAQLYDSLREADRRKDEFLATLAHELRNPLAPIRTGLEIMKMAKQDEQTFDEIRNTMERQTQQLITLVDDLLDVSRITGGKLELRKCRVILSEVVQSAVEAAQPVIDEGEHALMIRLPPNPVFLDADPHRLAQVLTNLLNNAANYTPDGGNISLVVEREGNEAVITVHDNGIGIPSEMLERVFDLFAQIQRPMEKGYTGLGIGLTLVKSLVEMHGGTVTVHSDGVGKGSEFSVRLPIPMEADAEAPGRTGAGDGRAAPQRRILIVDDNEAAAKMLSMVVKMFGNVVQTAGDGQEAVEVAPEFLPDVVVMDLGMPRMNGYEAAAHIRQQPWGKNMVLVALTGWGQEEDKRRTKEAGFDYHLVKPVEPAALQALLRDLQA